MEQPDHRDRRVLDHLWATLANPRYFVPVLLIGILAYSAEIGAPTFAHDVYFDTTAVNDPYYAFVQDGRYLAEIMRWLQGRVYPPTFGLLAALPILAASGVLIARLFGQVGTRVAVMVSAVCMTFPMLWEIFAYAAIRLNVPVALFCAVLATLIVRRLGDWIALTLATMLLLASLDIYQSTIYAVPILTCLVASWRLHRGENILDCLLHFVLPRAMAFILALLIYRVAFLGLVPHMIGIHPARYDKFAVMASSLGELVNTWRVILGAMWSILFRGDVFFPLSAKLVLVALAAYVVIRFALESGRTAVSRLIAILLVLVAPFFAFGVAWATAKPQMMLHDRILFPIVSFYCGLLALSWTIASRLARSAITAGMTIVVLVFCYQANFFHFYLQLRNQADMDMAAKISGEIVKRADYRPDKRLAIIGTTNSLQYLPYRVFNMRQQKIIGNSAILSSFATEWSANRLLLFYMETKLATPAEKLAARETAKTLPAWPQEGSIVIQGDVVILVLKTPKS